MTLCIVGLGTTCGLLDMWCAIQDIWHSCAIYTVSHTVFNNHMTVQMGRIDKLVIIVTTICDISSGHLHHADAH